MTLIKSISGIRGTLGGIPGTGLTPLDVVKFTSAYAEWIRKKIKKEKYKVVIGRDARLSGEMVESIVAGTLTGMGIDVINLGLAATPTVEIAVMKERSDGGIIVTASHNPWEWNALKLLNNLGEFISAGDGQEIVQLSLDDQYTYAQVGELGKVTRNDQYNAIHIREILELDLVDPEIIRNAGFRIAIDCINSVGGTIVPELLKNLGVREVIELNCKPDGKFSHNPEPLPENLGEMAEVVREGKADAGFAVDPDVDRLAIICENGEMFGEEYTLVAVADYILNRTPGNTASNLSSSMALKDITLSYGQKYFAAEVGEVNVVKVMKDNHCVIGGEGNGGVIYPALHYGRDALVGMALFLTSLALKRMKCSELKKQFPEYIISKNKIVIPVESDINSLFKKVREYYKSYEIDTRDGVRIDFGDSWIHLRKSNTEPVIRLYAEARNLHLTEILIKQITKIIEG